MLRTFILGAVAIAELVPSQASAQTASEMTMFSRGQFKGTRYASTGPRRSIDPPLTVRSVIIPPGTQWELCSGNTFTGCRQFAQSQGSMGMTVRSVRPVPPVRTSRQPAPPTATGRNATGRSQSLRGWASEYFVSPEVNGNRVQVPSGAAEAVAGRAGEFCRSRGWRSSAHQRLHTVGQTSYLADVLCVDTDN